MAKILITGANGFIGSHLARHLRQRGDEVTCLVRKTSRLDRLEGEGFALAYGDVTDRESLRAAVAEQEVLVHLAGCTYALSQEPFYRVHREGTRNLLSLAAEQPRPPVAVFVSSLAAAGPSPRGRLRTEHDPLCPVSVYGQSKRAGELVAEQFAGQVPITVVRPAIVFGEGDDSSLELFKMAAHYRFHLIPGFLPNRFSMLHVEDVVALLTLAADRGRRLVAPEKRDERTRVQGYYFGASLEHPTFYQFGRLLRRALGRWVIRMPVPSALTRAVGLIGESYGQIRRRPVLLGLDKAREATAGSWACSPQAAIDELGFTLPVSLQDRLHQTVEWYRRVGWL